jgi:signal transduction histidine kinase
VLVARIEAQLRLRALSIQLADQSRLSTAGTLAAGLAHEVKNPINAVLNAARLLPSVATKPETAEKLLRVILEGIQRIEETVSLLEEHVRPAEGGALVTCDLRAGLDSSLRLLEHKMNGIALHTSYGSTRQVVASARALNQVFLNLLDNAVRATPTNIWVSAADTDRGVKVTIADDGQGIPPETALLIFEPFFTTRELGEGTGLGLYLCRRIVQDSGGELRYQPRAGGGAEFTIELRSMVAAA